MVDDHFCEAEKFDLSGSQMIGLMRAVLKRGKPFRFQAGGTSMSPFIRDCDVISIVPLANRAPSLGAVIAFQRTRTHSENKPNLVVHRLIKKTSRGYFFLGDNQFPEEVEGPVSHADLLGSVILIERCGEKVRFGLGPERLVIALASSSGLLGPSRRFVSMLRIPYKKVFPNRTVQR